MEEIFCGDTAYVPSKVICVGRNFADHAKEMGSSAQLEEPVIFLKPNSSIAFAPGSVFIPSSLGVLHHEVELCALIGRRGKSLDAEGVEDAIAGYAVGIDFTLREVQAQAKGKGLPWTISKGFDSSCIVGRFVPSSEISDAEGLEMWLEVNGERRQAGNTGDMIFSPADIARYVSQYMTLERGDVIMCGTPAGVGEVGNGDRIAASIEGLPKLDFVVERSR